MGTMQTFAIQIVVIFIIGYAAIALEAYIRINKAATALLTAVICWGIYMSSGDLPAVEGVHQLSKLDHLSGHLADTAQIVFFLMGAMTIVEMIDLHQGFRVVTDHLNVRSKLSMLWLISIVAFCLSAVLDNLTTTIVMLSLLKKIIPEAEDRKLMGSMIVIAANAGGAWTPIGDVTTTMLWINGSITSWGIMKALFVPSVVCLIVSVGCLHLCIRKSVHGDLVPIPSKPPEPGSGWVLAVGLVSLILVPVFKAGLGLPPFLGILVGVAFLWILTDLMHHKKGSRDHLSMSYALTRIDKSSLLFFLGILLAVSSLDAIGVLRETAIWLETTIPNQDIVVVIIGLISAIVDNVPLVAATMGMYDLVTYPVDSQLWELIAYCAGTGGSILVIGSAAGVAYMGIEKVDFMWYLRKVSWIALVGYFAGVAAYLIMV